MTDKYYALIVRLLYPALFGAWMYESLDIIFNSLKNSSHIDLLQCSLAVSLLIHYVVDYLYTYTEDRDSYKWHSALIDCVILTSLYVAMKLSLSTDYKSMMHIIWTSLVAMKFVAMLWVLLETKSPKLNYIFRKPSFTFDFMFFVAYVSGLLYQPHNVIIFVAICILDSIYYKIDSAISQRLNQFNKKNIRQ